MNEKKGRFKLSFESRKFKNGAYSTIITVVVIAIILVVNLFVSELNIKIDLSAEKLFTLSDQTEEIVDSLDDKVTIYQIVQSGNDDKKVTEIINKYKALSNNITIVQKDPVLYPTFTMKYLGANETLGENSLIVECGERYKVVPYSDMLIQEFNMYTYSNDIVGLDVEGKLTAAILYVTSLDVPVMYVMEGHGEISLPEQINSGIIKENVDVQTLNLLTAENQIPDDAACILINAPQFDYSEEEVEQIIGYLSKGGRAIILVSYTQNKLTNFESLLEYYGLGLAEGIVVESNSNYYMSQRPAYLVPKINVHDTTTPIKNNNLAVISPLSKGLLQLSSVRNSLNITSLLNTSSDAYSIINVEATTYDKSPEDIDGPFDIAVAVEEEQGGGKTKLVVFGSNYFLDEQIITYSAAGNSDMFLNSVSWLVEQTNSISIRTRSVSSEVLSMTTAQIGILSIVTVIVIPAIFLVMGIAIWLRRRKK